MTSSLSEVRTLRKLTRLLMDRQAALPGSEEAWEEHLAQNPNDRPLAEQIERMWDDIGHSIRRSYDGRCDGVLLLAPSIDSEVLKTLWERGTPLVSIGTTVKLQGTSYIDIDNEDAAAGMLQSAFMHIYGKLGLLKDPASFPAWSYMTAAKRCRSYLSGSGRTVR